MCTKLRNHISEKLFSAKPTWLLVLSFVTGICLAAQVNAGDTFDNSFGIAGVAELSEHVQDRFHKMAVASDGSILVLGSTYADNSEKWNLLIARYHSDGTLDLTFGGDGKIERDFSLKDNEPRGIAVREDGKVVILSQTGEKASLIQHHSYGAPDEEFGTVYLTNVLPPLTGEAGQYYPLDVIDVAIVDDKIVVLGRYHMYRYNLDGTLDLTFGDQGMIWPVQMENDIWIHAVDMAVVGTKVYLLGENLKGPQVIALNDDGSLDTSIGVNGALFPPDGAIEEAASLAVHNDMVTIGGGDRIIRMDMSGMLDSNFSINGIVETPPGSSVTDVVLQTYGRVAASVKLAGPGGGLSNEIAVARFTSDGQPDSTLAHKTFGFPVDGWFLASHGEEAMASQLFGYANGKLLVAGGYRKNSGNENILLMRLDTSADSSHPDRPGGLKNPQGPNDPTHGSAIRGGAGGLRTY